MNPNWKSPFSWGYGTNQSGFNALPSGYRSMDGFIKDGAYNWGGIQLNIDFNIKKRPFHSILGHSIIWCDEDFFDCLVAYNYGFSIRCVKDW